MGKSRPISISISANQICEYGNLVLREFSQKEVANLGSPQSLWDKAIWKNETTTVTMFGYLILISIGFNDFMT